VSDPTEPAAPSEPAPPAVPAAPHGGWTAPAAPPFGAPAGPAPAPGAPVPPTYGRPVGAYAPPAGYAVPPAAIPPAYGAAPHAVAPYGGAPSTGGVSGTGPEPGAPRRATLGWVAFALSLVATVGASIVGAISAFAIGQGTGREIALRPLEADFDWSILTPVRDSVLVGEISFWAGTAIGVWALVQGIIAIVTGRGRGPGIAAVIIAAIGPIAFAVGVQIFLAAGLAAGSGIGG
jgi:hypothetical protein